MSLTKRTIASWDKKLAKHQETVAKERDKLDDTISELTGLRENCDEAWGCLQEARDRLSETV